MSGGATKPGHLVQAQKCHLGPEITIPAVRGTKNDLTLNLAVEQIKKKKRVGVMGMGVQIGLFLYRPPPLDCILRSCSPLSWDFSSQFWKGRCHVSKTGGWGRDTRAVSIWTGWVGRQEWVGAAIAPDAAPCKCSCCIHVSQEGGLASRWLAKWGREDGIHLFPVSVVHPPLVTTILFP